MITATATLPVKPMNQRSLMPCSMLISAVPVLPASSTPCNAAAVPDPSRTTDFIIVATLAALSGDMTRSACSGSGSSTVRPSGSMTFSTSRGSMRRPPLPIV